LAEERAFHRVNAKTHVSACFDWLHLHRRRSGTATATNDYFAADLDCFVLIAFVAVALPRKRLYTKKFATATAILLFWRFVTAHVIVCLFTGPLSHLTLRLPA